jgi:putative peptidoglycan lipid II flippase
MRRLRDRHDAADAEEPRPADEADQPMRLDRGALPPVPGAAGARPLSARPLSARPPVPSSRAEDDLDWGGTFTAEDDDVRADDGRPRTTARRRLAVIGLPLLALALVVAFALWFGNNVLSVAGNVDDSGSTPSVSATAGGAAPSSSATPPAPVAGAPVPVTAATIFNPFGDGEPENDDDVPLTVDGDPATAWSTVTYRGSAAFGNLKPGVGVLLDLGSEQALAGVTVATTLPGSTVEVRTGGAPDAGLDAFAVSASGPLTGTDDLAFTAPVTSRYVLVWLTGLVPVDDGFQADLAEVTVTAAG